MSQGGFDGFVTVENITDVTERIRSLLTDARYTFRAFDATGKMYHERFGQTLQSPTSGDPFTLTFFAEDHACLTVCDSYGVWQIGTNRAPELPHVTITASQIRITQRAPIGDTIVWVIDVEQPPSVLFPHG